MGHILSSGGSPFVKGRNVLIQQGDECVLITEVAALDRLSGKL